VIPFHAKVIRLRDLNQLVVETYGRPYNLQQQEGCMLRCTISVTVPDPDPDDFESVEIPEVINGEVQGVSFAAWLARDPAAPIGDRPVVEGLERFADRLDRRLFWERSFYPSLGMVLNDLHTRGLIPADEYGIVIDW